MIGIYFFRLLVGFHPVWRNKRITILGVDWSFERAVVYKTDEGFVEAGLQTLLQTYIHMNTEFRTYRHPLVKSFYLAGSKYTNLSKWLPKNEKRMKISAKLESSAKIWV